MNQNAERLIKNLSPDIDRKCAELKAARRERLLSGIFVLLCAMVVILPALLVFFGVSLTALIAPLVFMSLSIILLLPVLLSGGASNHGGTAYE